MNLPKAVLPQGPRQGNNCYRISSGDARFEVQLKFRMFRIVKAADKHITGKSKAWGDDPSAAWAEIGSIACGA